MTEGPAASDPGVAVDREAQRSLWPWRRRSGVSRFRRPEPSSILEHLDELRSRLLKALGVLTVGALIAFIFRDWCFDLLVAPFREVAGDQDLVFFRPTEAFSLFMQISLFGGLVLASPVILYQLWAFVGPGLTRGEKRRVVPVALILSVLFIGGVLLGYFALERGLGFLLGFGSDRLEPTIGADHYLNFALRFLLVFGVAFEFPVFLFALTAAGVVDWRTLARGRRWAIIVIVVGGAVATPSGDPLTLALLAVPLYVLYEATIWLSRFLVGPRRRGQAQRTRRKRADPPGGGSSAS